ncbi:hypothetical protein JHC09_15725 [Devosia sp. MC532]|uniref:DUF6925 family protein n=1 Tax=Devosia sp. MC532 TaxID=2799788 RepID=UPI0018F471CB|nr:hypothetical protein [Devosia sp. MC532]MBJ7579325.1 hypothetical protein [Devosia sp. MC532]
MKEVVRQALLDPRNTWSIGTFGAIGEFRWDAGEETLHTDALSRVTKRAAIRITPADDIKIIAFETLAADGKSWHNDVAFCMKRTAEADKPHVVRELGPDRDALREDQRDAILFDLGVGIGHVHMCARTHDPDHIKIMRSLEGLSIFSEQARHLHADTLRAQPHRVMLSPLGRLEVYQEIPHPNGKSPEGPHTHLIAKSIASGRTHAATDPIPEGYQPILTLHPGSPWRDVLGHEQPFSDEKDAAFLALWNQYALPDEHAIAKTVRETVTAGTAPRPDVWPDTRRGRTTARVALRRLTQKRDANVAAWASQFDNIPADQDAELLAE